MARTQFRQRRRAAAFRARVAKEIVDSEREYVTALSDCKTHFYEPMRSNKNISDELLTQIFSTHFDAILHLSVTLLADVEMRAANWTSRSCLGDVFAKIAGFLKVYTPFIEGFDASIRARQELSKRARHVVEQCESKAGGKHSLGSCKICFSRLIFYFIIILI